MRALRVAGLALCTLLASHGQPAHPPQAAPAQARPSLVRILSARAGAAFESAMGRNETHDYFLSLTAGTFADLAVDQRGIDVAVTVYGPDGRRLATSDSFFGAWGTEPVPVIAERSGRYRLEVRSSAAGTLEPGGKYEARLMALGPAQSRDRARIAAENLFTARSYRQALSGFRAAGERRREAETLYTLASIDFDLDLAKQALALFRSLDRKSEKGQTLSLLGRIYGYEGKYAQALEPYRQALALSQHLSQKSSEATVLMNLGTAYRMLGETGTAITHFQHALDLWHAVGNRSREATTRASLGDLYQSLGESQEGLDQLVPALAVFKDEGNLAEEARTLNSMGNAYSRAGQIPKGIENLKQAFTLEHRDRRSQAVTLNDLGCVYILRGDWPQAREYFAQARTLFHGIGDGPEETVALANVAWTEVEANRPQAAIEAYQQALPRLTALGDRATAAFARLGLARARRDLGDLAGARETIRDGIAQVESLRGTTVSPALRTAAQVNNQAFYAFEVDLLMAMHRVDEALAASERARARGLLDLLAESRTDLRRGVDPALLARVDAAGRRVNEADRQRWKLENVKASRERQAAERTLRQALADLDRAQTELRQASPAYVALAQSLPLSVPEIQRQVLDADTLLLEYHLGKERSFVWAVTPDRVAAFPLPGRAEIEEAARRGYKRLERSRGALARLPAADSQDELSQLLLKPVAGFLGRKRLLIVPDGALFYLPFAALSVPGSSEPLVAAHEVVISPSASALAVARRELAGRRSAPGTLAVVADPVFNADGLQSLPYSSDEATDLLELVPENQRLDARGFGASREAVLSGKLARYRIVHLATHGEIDTEHPELSKLIFSQVDEQGRPQREDGFVWAHEIYGLHLPADLVVLSACSTALGTEIRGEGLVGLTRGFQYAGARAVLVSLWEVDDAATAELMRRFYREMLAHGQPAAALRGAQDGLRRQKEWEAPYYWAGFILQGDWRAGQPFNRSAPPGSVAKDPATRGLIRRMR